jgi:hypothetical protein
MERRLLAEGLRGMVHLASVGLVSYLSLSKSEEIVMFVSRNDVI